MIEEIYDVRPESFNTKLKSYLKSINNMKPLQDYDIMKTGSGRELAPTDDDWFLLRAASVFREIVKKGVVTPEFIANRYGSRKNRGCRPSKYVPAYKEIGVSILDNFHEMGWINLADKKDMLTEQGKKIALEIIEKAKEKSV